MQYYNGIRAFKGHVPASLFTRKSCFTTYVFVTPALAAEYLDTRNDANPRCIVGTRVHAMSSSMRLGRFAEVCQGVSVGQDGHLVDGQHRLSAIVESGIARWVLFTFGVKPTARQDIDTTVTPRAFADNLKVHLGVSRMEAQVVASAVRQILDLAFGVRRKLSQAEVDGLADAYKNAGVVDFLLDSFGKNAQWPKNSNIQPVFGALATAYPLAPEKIQAFTRKFSAVMNRRDVKGDGATPLSVLVNYLDTSPSDSVKGYVYRRDASSERARKVLNVLKNYLQGKTMQKVVTLTDREFILNLRSIHKGIIGEALLTTIIGTQEVPATT